VHDVTVYEIDLDRLLASGELQHAGLFAARGEEKNVIEANMR
jgi:hypothetical protein